jgi:hypothetical protein
MRPRGEQMNSKYLQRQQVWQFWEVCEQLANAKRMQSAKMKYEELLDMDLDVEARALAIYNTGVFYLNNLGNGIQARQLFKDVVNFYEENPHLKVNSNVGKYLAWAYENLMLLSLSYDEYDDWAEHLRAVSPEEDILKGQVPIIREKQEAGMPWSDMMIMISSGYYDRNDPAQDPGKYGFGAGTLQLLLENRKRLRLSGEDWATALYEYGALMIKLNMESTRAMEVQGFIYPQECRFYLENGRDRLDEFLASNQPNDAIQKLSKSLVEMLEMSSQGGQGLAPVETPYPVAQKGLPLSCVFVFAIPIAILFVFYLGRWLHWW